MVMLDRPSSASNILPAKKQAAADRPSSASILLPATNSTPATRRLARPASASRLFESGAVDSVSIQVMRRWISPKLWSSMATTAGVNMNVLDGPKRLDLSSAVAHAGSTVSRPVSGMSRASSSSSHRLLPTLPEKQHKMSDRRVKAIDGVWRREVEKCEEVEDRAWDLQNFRQYEAHVARRCAASRNKHVRAARHTLAAAGAGLSIAITPEMSDTEATREAVRETMFDCVRREEIKNKSELADKESSLAESRMRHTEDMRAVQQRRVDAKRMQEAEHLAHLQKVEADRLEREAQMARDREENAAAKARAQKEQEAKRQERVEKVARILEARRKAADEKAKAAARAAEEAIYEKARIVAERTMAREAAKAGAKREAALEFAHRLEKVWKHAETVVARCQREYSNLRMIAVERESSYTQDELERRMQALETAKGRAAAARESLDRCLEEKCGVYVASRHVRDEEEQAGAPE